MVLNFEEYLEDGEEGETIRTIRSHRPPSRAEREAHDKAPIPYRRWCKHCVAGRGLATQHKARREGQVRYIADVALYDCFIRDEKGS